MPYTYQNCYVEINGKKLPASQLSFVSNTNISPAYRYNSSLTSEYKNTNNAPGGTIGLQYYLYTEDPFIGSLSLSSPYELDINGLKIKEAYLQSYDLNIVPYKVIEASAQLVFFEKVNQDLNPRSVSSLSKDYLPMHGQNVSLTNGNGFSTYIGDNVSTIQYKFQNNITPFYSLETGFPSNYTAGQSPHRVFVNNKSVETIIEYLDNDSISIPLAGNNVGALVTFTNPSSSVTQTLLVTGVLTQKTQTVQEGGDLKITAQILQNQINNYPKITNITDPLVPGSSFTIDGVNFNGVQGITLGDTPITSFSVSSDKTQISTTVPLDVSSGVICVETESGPVYTEFSSAITFPNISINGISPTTAVSGKDIQITGSNFYRIDNVLFGSTESTFEVVNPNLIIASVPTESSKDKITVSSSYRNKSAQSDDNFYPMPIIYSIFPMSGLAGEIVHISGKNLADVSNVYFNANSATFSATSTVIDATVPNASIYGDITIKNIDNTIITGSSKFEPIVKITGICPITPISSNGLRISGSNIKTDYLYEAEPDRYRVLFPPNIITNFQVISETLGLLSGQVPANISAGTIFLVKPDGVSVYPDGYKTIVQERTPIIKSLSKTVAITGQKFNTTILGERLQTTKYVNFTYAPGGCYLSLQNTSAYVKVDYDGRKVDVVDYIFTGAYQYNVSITFESNTTVYSPKRFEVWAMTS